MNIKYIGLLFIFIACTFFGCGLAVSEKRRIDRSQSLRDLIVHIQREIECFRAPLENIYSSFHSEALKKSGFTEKMRQNSLRYALESAGNIFCFSDGVFSSLLNFADFLGKSEYTDQISRCKYIILQLDDELKKSRESYPKNRKMYSSLGILTGIMIVILLL